MTTPAPAPNSAPPSSYLHRMWELGEHHLAARRYVLARRELEAAEAVAWRDHDAQALARLYLPLLEARRQIRYHAAEGTVLICAPAASTLQEQHLLDEFLTTDAGTILLSCAAEGPKSPHARRGKTGRGGPMACRFAGSVQFEAQRTGRWLEALLLIRRDRVIRDMLTGLGARVAETVDWFQPVRGAYGGPAHGHDHDGHDSHDHPRHEDDGHDPIHGDRHPPRGSEAGHSHEHGPGEGRHGEDGE